MRCPETSWEMMRNVDGIDCEKTTSLTFAGGSTDAMLQDEVER